jgi:aspartyl-tRNA(Asn)/glutamyl-tRNA(Gln) amidotransferase subunit C
MTESHFPIEHIARLARIQLTPEETDLYGRQLDQILVYFDRLREIDTTDIPPTTHVVDLITVMRDDDPRPSPPRDEMLAMAPVVVDGYIRVPPIFDER